MLLIFFKMLTIAVLLALGVLIYRIGILSDQGSQELSVLVLEVCNPVMMVASALEDDSVFTPAHLGLTLAVCTAIYLLLMAAGVLLPRLLRAPRPTCPYYTMLSLFGNVGFIGLPVGLSILGSGAMLYIVLFNLLYTVFFYSYGLLIMSKAVGQRIPFRPRTLLNPGMLSCVIALGVYLIRAAVPFSVPSLATEALDYISNATTFLAMLVLGVSLATTPLRAILTNLRMYGFILLRFAALPCLIALALRWLLPEEPMLTTAMALMAAMPAGNMPVMLANQYHTDTEVLTCGIILSTLLCVVTIPVVSLFFPL